VHLTPPGEIQLQTTWRASHTARRHAPTVPLQYRYRLAATTTPPGALLRRHRQAPASAVTTVTDLIPVRLAARSRRQALY